MGEVPTTKQDQMKRNSRLRDEEESIVKQAGLRGPLCTHIELNGKFHPLDCARAVAGTEIGRIIKIVWD